jgi:hypothetical protein
MLSSPVYSEAHPRRSAAFPSRMDLRDAAHSAPTPVRVPRPSAPQPRAIPSSFLFNRFQTLFSPRRTTVLNNPFGIKRFRTLSRYNGGIPASLYFPPLSFHQSPLFLTLPAHSLRSFTKEWSRTPLQPARSALFFKTAGCIGVCNQFFELRLLEDSRLTAMAGLRNPTPRRAPTEHHLSSLISFSCRLFPSQRTGTPPSPQKKSSLSGAKPRDTSFACGAERGSGCF